MCDKIRKLMENNIFNNSSTQTFSHKSCCKTHLGIHEVIILVLEITNFLQVLDERGYLFTQTSTIKDLQMTGRTINASNAFDLQHMGHYNNLTTGGYFDEISK